MKLKYISTTLQCAALTMLAFSLPSTVNADEAIKHPAKPFLWKVEGKDLTKPSYLFGTVHVSDPAAATLHPAAQKAFDSADSFYAEVDMTPEKQMEAMPLMMRQDGKTLSESIGEELSKQLDAELALINPQITSAPFQPMKTWLVSSLPSILPDQMAGKKPLDLQLWEAATTAKKKTAGLETMEGQLKGFNALTEPEQIALMAISLKLLKEERAKEVNTRQQIVNAYIAGDEAKIIETIHASFLEMQKGDEKELGEKLLKSVLIDRDKTISESILKELKADAKSSHFFAVGTAHYCTEKSILSYVKDAGYTVTRIEK